MTYDQQRARELLDQSLSARGVRLAAGSEFYAAALDAITAALRAAPDELAERHAAAERDACRWARIAEEHREGRLAALERVAELEAKLRAAPECPEGFVMVPEIATEEMLSAAFPRNERIDDSFDRHGAWADCIAARPQGVK